MTVTKGMVLVPAGSVVMGSTDFYLEERPLRPADVPDLWFDEHPVTNAQFRRFVRDTGHVTVAERTPAAEDFPDADPDQLVPGSQVFTGTEGPVSLDDWTRWWTWVPGANWRHPQGTGSTLDGLDRHPVVHVGFEDAIAYAEWAGKTLPTEEQWEHAARGGLHQASYPWGDDFTPRGKTMANTWWGRFPWENLATSQRKRTTPVKSYPPNGFGLFDVVGNVWEWTRSAWTATHVEPPATQVVSCCGPAGELTEQDRRVIKGGSHLCAPSYCHRYRPAARQGHTVRSSTSHIGFRCCQPA